MAEILPAVDWLAEVLPAVGWLAEILPAVDCLAEILPAIGQATADVLPDTSSSVPSLLLDWAPVNRDTAIPVVHSLHSVV